LLLLLLLLLLLRLRAARECDERGQRSECD
jgi:hypothetical protein